MVDKVRYGDKMVQEFSDADIVMWLKLITVGNGLGPVKLQKLLEKFNNNLDRIFNAPESELLGLTFLNGKIINRFNELKNANDAKFYELIETCKKNDIKIVPFISEIYPKSLKSIPSPPLTLYLLGNVDLLKERPSIAIVGTRDPSEKAKKMAYEFSKDLANKGILVISGGALGIDTAAHLGSLESENKAIISVLGSGFFHPYPPENKILFERIVKLGGLLISENSPNFPGATYSFLQRNKIISGLSNSVLIVAAKETGGGLEQVKTAYTQRKLIFCPKVMSEVLPNEGIRKAIKEYNAKEIESVEQILETVPEYMQVISN